MISAIDNYHIEGIETTLSFGKYVCQHPAFISGDFDTHFVKKYWSKEIYDEGLKSEKQAAAQIALHHYLESQKKVVVANTLDSNWKTNRS